jgi:hypothetical protein
MIFQQDLEALSVCLERPFPEFFGVQLNDQPGGELQWKVIADLRGKQEPPTSEGIRFSVRENNWLDGLARAMQEALARLCGQNVSRIKNLRFIHYARHDSMGAPMDLSPHPGLKYHVEHLDFMLVRPARSWTTLAPTPTPLTSSEQRLPAPSPSLPKSARPFAASVPRRTPPSSAFVPR